MGQRAGVDGAVEIASQIEQRLNPSWIQDPLVGETVFFFVDGQDLSDKKIMISVGAALSQAALETNVCIVDNRR